MCEIKDLDYFNHYDDYYDHDNYDEGFPYCGS
jgi:hypothetical protein